jgi:hypothetical protein
MIGVGPYDMWAIEYGYTLGDTKEVLKKVSDPMHDLRHRRGHRRPRPPRTPLRLSSQPPRLRPAASWPSPRLLSRQDPRQVRQGRRAVVQGTPRLRDHPGHPDQRRQHHVQLDRRLLVNRDRKGDPGNRAPSPPVSADQPSERPQVHHRQLLQRRGLRPHARAARQDDRQQGREPPAPTPTWPVTDRITGVPSPRSHMLMSPSRLRRVYDNETYVDRPKDAVHAPRAPRHGQRCSLEGTRWASRPRFTPVSR